MEDKNINQVLSRGWYQWEWGKDIRKACRRVNKYYVLVYENGKNETC
jgi:hypothetical protein